MVIDLKKLQPAFFSVAATLFIGLAFTSADFFTSPVSGWKDATTLLLQWALVVVALFPVVHLLSLNKYIFAALFPPICLLSGILAYFRYTTGTVLTAMLIDIILDHDATNGTQLISTALLSVATGSLLAGIAFTVYRFKKIGKISKVSIHILASITLIFILFGSYRIKRPAAERIPLNIFFVTERYVSERKVFQTQRPPLPAPENCFPDKPITVFIIGESLRPDHLGFNGYARNTTPHLSEEDIISFPNIYSEATYTNASIQVIMTRADSIESHRTETERSFIDLFKQCGYYSVWLANQEQRKSYYYFMKECDTLVYGNINKSTYVFDLWTDELLLPAFDSLLATSDSALLFVIHTIGSHWFYNSHCPESFQQFAPVAKSRIITSNTSEEMINSYDNTILYTDFFIYNIINRLRDRNAILYYLSDHGEALGEDGQWLHATETPAAHSSACFIWMSPEYKTIHPEKYEAAMANRLLPYNTAFLFHTICDGAGIESEAVEKKESGFLY